MMTASSAGLTEHGTEWVQAHEALSRLARQRAAADAEEGRWLLRALRSAAHVHLGFGSFGEYIERLFGYKPRSTQEKLRVAEALEDLPALAHALEAGVLAWSAVRELTRVAVAENERKWLDLAIGKTLRQLEQLVEGKRPGDDPAASPSPEERRHVLRFDVTAETFALFREAILQLRRRTDSMLDDDAALLSLARHVLGGPADPGRANYQIALTVCARCGSGHLQAAGELVAVGADVIERARCDGQHVGYVDHRAANENAAVASVAPNDRTHTDTRFDAHVGAEQVDAHVGAVRVNAHVGADDHERDGAAHPKAAARANGAPAPARAKQTIPPALRRAALRRDNERCRVPGCKNATFLDLHHLDLRSEGGQDEAANLVTLCGAHHRATHRGELVITGGATNAQFRHADGSEYGQPARTQAIEAHAKVFSALRHLGFRQGEVQKVMAELREESALQAASAEVLLREALRRMGTGGARPMQAR
jgi:hypothetical protein